MASKIFLTKINQAQAGQSNDYYIELEFSLIDTGIQQYGLLQFYAPWGADWKLMAKQAAEEWATAQGITIDGIVFPDLSTV